LAVASKNLPKMKKRNNFRRVVIRGIVLPLVVAALSACASIDFDYPREESHPVFDTEGTYLGARYAELNAEIPEGSSAFHPLVDGIDALAARLLLAEKAERTIDTQYYLIKTDHTSYAFIDALLKAADRGVRVRLLLDDVFTTGYDTGMAALDSHPNFEIRIFNPFNRGAMGKAWAGTTNLSRVNRRMHTKSFTVDSQATIVGGRNIADEYFGAREDAKFGDLDVVGIGQMARDVSTMFDTFWNHETALPVPAFANMPDDPAAELVKLRERLSSRMEEIKQGKYADAVRATEARFMTEGSDAWEIAPYKLVYDTPDKGIKSKEGPEQAITQSLAESIQAADNRLVVLSPYFVPMKSGIELFAELEERGVEVVIVTNSLAANNHATVHGGYTPSRKPLLRAGVEIYEVRPDAEVPGSEIVAASGAKATMHTKAYLVDDDELFIGSFNFDPRSANLNTESGVLVHSEELADMFYRFFDAGRLTQAYEVTLDEDGDLLWRTIIDGEEKTYTKEPESTWGQRFTAGFMRIMPVRSQL
jgi:putative cardiolipin synthase